MQIFIYCVVEPSKARFSCNQWWETNINTKINIGKGINDHYKGIIGKFDLNDEENIFDIKLNDSEFSRVGFIPQDKVFGNYCVIFRQAFDNSYIKLTNNIKKYLKELKFLNFDLVLKNLKLKNFIFLLKKFFF